MSEIYKERQIFEYIQQDKQICWLIWWGIALKKSHRLFQWSQWRIDQDAQTRDMQRLSREFKKRKRRWKSSGSEKKCSLVWSSLKNSWRKDSNFLKWNEEIRKDESLFSEKWDVSETAIIFILKIMTWSRTIEVFLLSRQRHTKSWKRVRNRKMKNVTETCQRYNDATLNE